MTFLCLWEHLLDEAFFIDVNGRDRGPRQREPQDTVRVGRHSREHALKWLDTAQEILAALPEGDDVEVHVLGGGKTQQSIIEHTPRN